MRQLKLDGERNYSNFLITINNPNEKTIQDLHNLNYKEITIGYEVNEQGHAHIHAVVTVKSKAYKSILLKKIETEADIRELKSKHDVLRAKKYVKKNGSYEVFRC